MKCTLGICFDTFITGRKEKMYETMQTYHKRVWTLCRKNRN